MIPSLEATLDGYYFFARRYGELVRYVRRHVVAALDEASALAYLCLDVAEGKVTYDDVRAWFAAHLAPTSHGPWPPG